MRKISLILLLIGLGCSFSYSQKDEDRVNFFDGIFFMEEEDYRDALSAFMKVYDAGFQNNANINYKIGVCYLNISGEKEKAIPFLEEAVKNIAGNYREGIFNEERAPFDALLFLGNAYRINYQLDSAISAYNRYIDKLEAKNEIEIKYTLQQIEACQRAKLSIENPAKIRIENLGTPLNTGLDNLNAVLSGNGEFMAYVSEQKFYDAVYFVEKQGSRWANPVNVTPQIQSDGDQYVTSLSYDGTKMFLSKISNFDADIMVSEYRARTWSRSENIGKPINSKFFESHAFLSPDGNTLYFTSNRSESLGGMDIFFSRKMQNGDWGEPQNLGSTINTSLNEDSPFLTPDGKTLFFSSQGHTTIGGYDIFYSTLGDDGNWSEPVNLPFPLNTTDDDVFFYPLGKEKDVQGYITRYDPEGIGSGDIYRVETLPTEDIALEEEETPILGETEAQAVEEKDISEMDSEPIIPDTTVLTPVLVEEEIKEPEKLRFNIRPVFFDFDSYALNDIAKGRLNDLTEAMNEYPQLKIEVHGHTDSKGPDAYNQILSERRASEVIKYLVSKGIDRERLTLRAFSENKPAAMNTTPDGRDSVKGRMLNRRVEFRITTRPFEWIELEEVEVPDELKVNN